VKLRPRALLALPLLLAALAFVAAAQSPQPARLIGGVENQALARDSGCRYARRDAQPSAPYIFISGAADTVLMNIDGRDVRLQLVSTRARQRRKNRTYRGDRFVTLYRADGATVRVVETVTDACRYGDSLCEFNFLRAVITVSKGQRREVVRAAGACGMGEP
jgi:hypothetical protein